MCDNIVGILNKYFASVYLQKVAAKEGHVIYAACIATGLVGGFKRYLLAMVPTANAIVETARLGELRWVSVQTRTLYNSYKIKAQAWKLDITCGDVFLRNSAREDSHSVYYPEACGTREDGYEIILLHDPKKKSKMQYNNRITFSAAVESFQMVFTRKISRPPPSVQWYHQPVPDVSEEINDSFTRV